ncbi:MAG: zinc ribbon domain-containing protein [Chlorobi bacterium]|nr:zinc ribbon domain-containing protein [Chlorobiota bacterium]
MPTYEYRCNECGKRFELFQKMSDKPIESCPTCKGNVTRLIGAGMGIIFKGSGFYETDYKHNGEKKSPVNNKTKKVTKAETKDTSKKEVSKESKDPVKK